MSISRTALSCTALLAIAGVLAATSADAKGHPKHKLVSASMHGHITVHPAAYFGGTAERPGSAITLGIGHGQLIKLAQPITDLFTSNAAAVDVKVNSPTEIYVFGKARGLGTIYATNGAGQVVYSANVDVEQNIDTLQEMLNAAMPEDQITVTHLNTMIILSGTVLNPEDATQAVELVNGFIGNDPKNNNGKVDVMVINRMKTATPQQVNLQVRIAEVSKTFEKKLGNSLALLGKTSGGGLLPFMSTGTNAATITAGTSTTPWVATFTQPTGSNTFGLAKSLGSSIIGDTLDLAETNGEITTLAQPNLTALSGETASFLAGGEIPLAVATPSTTGITYTIEYKQYGVSLSFTPVVLADGRISMRVRPEVSQLDYSHSITVGTAVIPALTTRRSETTVELGSGQSMVIAGLMNNTINNQKAGTPGLGDVPVLGAMFRSSDYQRGETELMVVVTPYLVKPVNTNQIVLPTDAVEAPTDAQRLFLGKNVDGKTGGDRPKPTMATPVTNAAPAVGALQAPPVASAPVAPAPPAAPQNQVGQNAPAPQSPSQKSKRGLDDASPGFGS